MKHDVSSFLGDIPAAIQSIEDFLNGVDETTFLASDLMRSAVERKFIIIGEALSQVDKLGFTDGIAIAEQQQIIGFRHRFTVIVLSTGGAFMRRPKRPCQFSRQPCPSFF